MVAFGLASGTRKVGRAARTAAYVERSGPYAGRRSTSPEEMGGTGAGNMPGWATMDPRLFWAAADRHERANGRAANTRRLTLPRGLGAAQQQRAAVQMANHLCGTRHAYQWAIHKAVASDGGEQPHVHIMWSPREADGIERGPDLYFRRYNPKNPEKGGARKATVKGTDRAARAAAMYAEREAWATICNEALETASVLDRVDPRSNAARGLARPPEPKLRPDQRTDKVALGQLHAARRAWAKVEAAEQDVHEHERLAKAHSTASKRDELFARMEARSRALNRVAAAHQPGPVLGDGLATVVRRTRAEAVRAAKVCRQEETDRDEAQVRARARLEAALPQSLSIPGDGLATVVRRTRAEAVRAAKVCRQEETDRDEAQVRAQARLEAALRLGPVPQDGLARLVQQIRNALHTKPFGFDAALEILSSIWTGKKGNDRIWLVAQMKAWSSLSSQSGLHGIGSALAGIGSKWAKAEKGMGDWHGWSTPIRDLATTIGRLTWSGALEWIERLRRAKAESDEELRRAKAAAQAQRGADKQSERKLGPTERRPDRNREIGD